MKVIAADDHRSHESPFEIVGGKQVPAYEHPGRIEAIRAELGDHSIAPPERGAESPIRAVHGEGLLHHLATAWDEWVALGNEAPAMPDTFPLRGLGDATEPATIEGRLGYYCFDMGTPILAGTYAAARASADIAITGAREVLHGEPAVYSLCRPPGHHATTNAYGGYCFLNNSAIAARVIQRETGSKVAVVDVDYHHGNGTQEIFWSDPDVLTVSLHGHPDFEYPYFTGRADERGAADTNLNIPLDKGTTGDAFLEALDRALESVAEFGAAYLVVPFGADIAAEDPMGTFEVHPEHFNALGARLSATDLPLLIVQEGGYDVPATAAAVRELLAGAQ